MEKIICSKCEKENTEFDEFKICVEYKTNWLVKLVANMTGDSLNGSADVKICQSCVSKTFRSFRKDT